MTGSRHHHRRRRQAGGGGARGDGCGDGGVLQPPRGRACSEAGTSGLLTGSGNL